MADRRKKKNNHVLTGLSPEGHAGWEHFSSEFGPTKAALADAIGLQLAKFERGQRLPPLLEEALRHAAGEAATRRQRPRRRTTS